MPEVYHANGVYWLRTNKGDFVATNIDVIRRRLKRRGFSGENTKSLNSEIENILDDLVEDKSVGYVGALAGYDVGVYDMNGVRVLVTAGPRVITGNPDYDNDFVHAYIERLLGDEAIHFHAWMKLARQALLAKSRRTGQVMVLTGAKNHGKSFLAKRVMKMLGGRFADPAQYLQGTTQFNAHLFSAELLLMDDKGGGSDYETRKAMADGLKQLVAGALAQCHAKGQTPITLEPFWRVLICVNDDPEQLQVLPPDSVHDKMIILRTCDYAVDRDTSDPDTYDEFERDFEAGIPDYLGWLDAWEIPVEMKHGRFGIKPYCNPEIDEMLHQFTPEQKLGHLIAEEIQSDADQELTAREIEKALKAPGLSSVEREAGSLLRGPGSCGKYLVRLCKSQPWLIQHYGRNAQGFARYLIKAPIAPVSTKSPEKD